MKKSVCIFAAVLILVLCLPFCSLAAVKAEEFVSGGTISVDSMNYGNGVIAWTASDADIKFAESDGRNCLEFSAASSKTATLTRNFEPAADLESASEISFFFFGETPKPEKSKGKKAEEPEPADCRVTLTVHSGEECTTITDTCKTGEWQALSFDIGGLRYRYAIDRIDISVRIFSDIQRETDVFRIGELFGSDATDADTYHCFLSGSFTTAAGTANVSDGRLTFDTAKDGFLSASIPILSDPDVNGIWLRLDNRSNASSLSVTCLSEQETSVSESNTTSIQISSAAGERVYYAKLPAISDARKIVITLPDGNAEYEGNIDFYMINPVKLTDKAPQSKLGNLSSVTALSGGKTIKASGTMTAEAVVKYSGKNIGLYAVSDDGDMAKIADGSISPLASVPVSMRFDIRAKTSDDSVTEYCGRFVVAVVGELDENGNPVTVGQERYISVLSDGVTADTKNGICAPVSASALSISSDFTVIEVDCGKLRSGDGVGTFYRSGENFKYYNTAYITELDRKISSASCECAVILRLVMTDGNSDSTLCSYEGSAPALTADGTERRNNIAMLSAFLADRYKKGAENGEIVGMILGREADSAGNYGYYGGLDEEEYVSLYFDTLMTVSSAAGTVNPNLEFYASVGGDFSAEPPMLGGGRSLLFLDTFMKIAAKYGKTNFGISFESSEMPGGKRGLLAGDRLPELEGYLTYFSDYLGVSASYIMYIWSPQNGESAAAAYTETASAVAASTKLHRFALNLTDGTLDSFLPALSSAEYDEFAAGGKPDKEYSGSYDYFDFTASYDSGDFEPGDGCLALSSGMGGSGRALVAQIGETDFGFGGFFRRFTVPEDVSEIDCLTFEIFAEADSELKILLGDGEKTVTYSSVLSAGENSVSCDLGLWESSGKLKFIRILTDRAQTLKLEKITGYSSAKTSEELTEIVGRARSEGQMSDAAGTPLLGRVELAIALVSLIVITVSAVFILGRRK